jgi:hypothetical protein
MPAMGLFSRTVLSVGGGEVAGRGPLQKVVKEPVRHSREGWNLFFFR